METIKFKQVYDKYNTSEVAGFPEQKAKELVDDGIAEYYPRKQTKQKQEPIVDKMVDKSENKEQDEDELDPDKFGVRGLKDICRHDLVDISGYSRMQKKELIEEVSQELRKIKRMFWKNWRDNKCP